MTRGPAYMRSLVVVLVLVGSKDGGTDHLLRQTPHELHAAAVAGALLRVLRRGQPTRELVNQQQAGEGEGEVGGRGRRERDRAREISSQWAF